MIRQVGQLNDEKWSKFHESARRVYSDEGIAPTVPTSAGGGHVPKVMRQPLKFLGRNQRNIDGDYAFTLDSANTGGVRVSNRIRKLTPTECERLQGFPDGWTEGVSDTQRYKQLGNAVTVNVVEAVARRLS
jgi:DNA (cytosine-5)-methyltransferase 1